MKIKAIDISECAIFVALMVASAFIQIPFPLMPLTFQTAVATLSGLILGAKKGAAAMAVYCFSGLLGLPVFSMGGGLYYVLKPSFGYIIGFIFSAMIGGLIRKSSLRSYVFAAICAVFFDYVIGCSYCLIASKLLGAENLKSIFLSGNLIYLPKDLLLGVLGAFTAFYINPVLRKRNGLSVKDKKGKS